MALQPKIDYAPNKTETNVILLAKAPNDVPFIYVAKISCQDSDLNHLVKLAKETNIAACETIRHKRVP